MPCSYCMSFSTRLNVVARGHGSIMLMPIKNWLIVAQITPTALTWLLTRKELDSQSRTSDCLTRGNSTAMLMGWLLGAGCARHTSEYLVRKHRKQANRSKGTFRMSLSSIFIYYKPLQLFFVSYSAPPDVPEIESVTTGISVTKDTPSKVRHSILDADK